MLLRWILPVPFLLFEMWLLDILLYMWFALYFLWMALIWPPRLRTLRGGH